MNNSIFIIVTGLVDNGKTTFIEFLLKKKIAIKEPGFITQNISVYNFNYKKKNFFLFDLPGHDLFNELKLNIINFADVVIIILSNENIETINNLKNIIKKTKEKKIDIIICFNIFNFKNKLYNKFKFDNFINISAKNGYNIDLILEKLLLIKKRIFFFNYDGFIINSYIIDKINITKIMLLNGEIKIGDIIYFKNSFIKIENLYLDNFFFKKIRSPSIFYVKNQEFPIELYFKININRLENIHYNSNYNINNKIKIYIKTNSHNISYSINNYILNKNVMNKLFIIKNLVGPILESDIEFCLNFNCILFIVGDLNIVIKKKIEFYCFETIYEMINFIELKYLEKNINITSKLIVKNIFEIKKKDKVAGCRVIEGKISLNDLIKIYKNDEILYDGNITSIKKEKKIVFSVNTKEDCGIYIKNFNNYEIGYIIESYKKNE